MRAHRIVLATAVVLLGLLALATAIEDSELKAARDEVYERFNAKRKGKGLAPLKPDPNMEQDTLNYASSEVALNGTALERVNAMGSNFKDIKMYYISYNCFGDDDADNDYDPISDFEGGDAVMLPNATHVAYAIDIPDGSTCNYVLEIRFAAPGGR